MDLLPCGSSGSRRTCSAPGTTRNASVAGPGSRCGTVPASPSRPNPASATTCSTSASSGLPGGPGPYSAHLDPVGGGTHPEVGLEATGKVVGIRPTDPLSNPGER